MKITSLQEYGMRCILQLAMGGNDHPQTTTAIAEKEGISRDYVEKILFQLQKTGIVHSLRGVNGGYVLSRKAEDLSVGEIMRSLSEKQVRFDHIKQDLCQQFPGNESKCVHISQCSIRMLWSVILAQVYGLLNQMPLSFLIGTEQEVQQRLLSLMSKKTKIEVLD
jgi:Rrf2 family protein